MVAPGTGLAGTEYVGTGMFKGRGEWEANQHLAREVAVKNALGQHLKSILDDRVFMTSAVVLDEAILSVASSFVTSSTVLRERRIGQKSEVRMRIYFDEDAVRRKLAKIGLVRPWSARVGMYHIPIQVVDERYVVDSAPSANWEMGADVIGVAQLQSLTGPTRHAIAGITFDSEADIVEAVTNYTGTPMVAYVWTSDSSKPSEKLLLEREVSLRGTSCIQVEEKATCTSLPRRTSFARSATAIAWGVYPTNVDGDAWLKSTQNIEDRVFAPYRYKMIISTTGKGQAVHTAGTLASLTVIDRLVPALIDTNSNDITNIGLTFYSNAATEDVLSAVASKVGQEKYSVEWDSSSETAKNNPILRIKALTINEP